MTISAQDRMMTEFILDKLTRDGRITMLEVNSTFEFTTKSSLEIYAGQKLSVIIPKDVTLNEGDTLNLSISHVVLE